MKAAVLGLLLASATSVAAEPGEGAALFSRNCALCHQTGATGLAGQYPRLAGRVGRIAGKPEGRAYLIDVLTYGLSGQVSVDKSLIVGVMPPLPLSDDEVALVLSFVASLGFPKPTTITAEEVAAERAKPHKSGAEVHALRESLRQAKLIE